MEEEDTDKLHIVEMLKDNFNASYRSLLQKRTTKNPISKINEIP
jgi:hypothetical protein